MSTTKRAVLSGLLVTLGLMQACSDNISGSYPTRAEADKSGALARGWLPKALPDGSTGIVEIHNIDTNQTWGRFVFPSSTAEAFRTSLSEVDASRLAGQSVRSPGVDWWPPLLRGRLKKQELERSPYRFYQLQENGVLYLAIDWQRSEAFFWRPGS